MERNTATYKAKFINLVSYTRIKLLLFNFYFTSESEVHRQRVFDRQDGGQVGVDEGELAQRGATRTRTVEERS